MAKGGELHSLSAKRASFRLGYLGDIIPRRAVSGCGVFRLRGQGMLRLVDPAPKFD